MANGGPYPEPIHGTPKFDDFTEIDNPVDFEKLRGENPLFSDKGEGRYFFQRDGVSYHFVDRWSGLTSYTEIQTLAERGLYGQNICASLHNIFYTENGREEKIEWMRGTNFQLVMREYVVSIKEASQSENWLNDYPKSYPLPGSSGNRPDVRPMWLLKMDFQSLAEAKDFCSQGFLDRADMADASGKGFDSALKYYFGKTRGADYPAIVDAAFLWNIEVEVAKTVYDKDFTDSESAHLAIEHGLQSQSQVDEFRALGASSAEDYERLRGALSQEWRAAEDVRGADELALQVSQFLGDPADQYLLSAEDYYLWLEVRDDWPLPPYDPPFLAVFKRQFPETRMQKAWGGLIGGHSHRPVFRPSSRQTINIVKQIDFSYHAKKDDMDRTRENLLSEPTISSLYGMICCSFIQNLPLLKILRQYSLDNLWQANMVNIVLSQGSTQISELLDSNMENYPIETSHPDQISVKPTDWKYQPHKIISGVRMWAVPEVNYEPNHPMAGPLSYLLDSATMSQKVEFIYHHKAMREIATFDNDNKVLIRK